MTKNYLISKLKSTGTAYLLWFFFGCHYAYLGMWGIQFLYWLAIIFGFFTFGFTWIWCLVDIFLIPGKISRYNLAISYKIESLEKMERQEEFKRNLALTKALRE